MPADLDHAPGADATPALLRLDPVPTALRTLGTIGIGMIPIHRLPRSVHIASVLAPVALTTGLLVRAQRRAVTGARAEAETAEADAEATDPHAGAETVPEREPIAVTGPTSTGPRWLPIIALSGAMGAALAGATYAGIRLDRAIENALRRRAVPAPRLVMGLASGALSLGMDLLESRAPATHEAPRSTR